MSRSPIARSAPSFSGAPQAKKILGKPSSLAFKIKGSNLCSAILQREENADARARAQEPANVTLHSLRVALLYRRFKQQVQQQAQQQVQQQQWTLQARFSLLMPGN